MTDGSSEVSDRQMYCRRCRYDLRGNTSRTCPECGREFDPANPKTFRRAPGAPRWRRVWGIGKYLLAALLLLACGWLWAWWGSQREQAALAKLRTRPDVSVNTTEMNLGKALIGRDALAFRVLNRTEALWLMGEGADPALLAEFFWLRELDLRDARLPDVKFAAGLARLERLRISEYKSQDAALLSDVSPLAHLANLQHLWLQNTGIRDVRPLAGLKKLDWLNLRGTQVTDVSPLAHLPLVALDLSDTLLATVAPLAELRTLRSLSLSDTRIKDLRPLAALPELDTLDISGLPPGTLATLPTLPELKYLVAKNIAPEELEKLPRLPALKTLWTNRAGAEGRKRLKARLGCEVD